MSFHCTYWAATLIDLHHLAFPIPAHTIHPATGYNSVQFSRSVMSYSLQPNGLQHARLRGPSPTPRACSNSCPSSRWCHPTISSPVISFCSCLQSFPASGSFPMSQLFAWGGQSIGVWLWHQSFQWTLRTYLLDWLDLLAVQGTLKSHLQHHSSEASILLCSAFFVVQLSHPYMTTGKGMVLTRWTFFGKEWFCFLICCLGLS